MFTVYYAVNAGGPWLIGLIAKQAGSARFAFDASAISLGVAVIFGCSSGTSRADRPSSKKPKRWINE
jgi:hypothetical protein